MSRRWILVLVIALSAITLACQLLSPGQPAISPVQENTPLATSPDSPIAPSLNGACANVLYPLSPGNQWVYQINNQGATSQLGLTVSSVSDTQATVDALSMGTGLVTQSKVECDQGAVKNFPLMTLGIIFGDLLDGQITTTHVSGVMAPAEDAFLSADWDLGWEGEYQANGTVHLQAEGDQSTITLADAPIRMKWQTAGAGDAAFESITVPAGTYLHALKVTRDMEIDANLQMESSEGSFGGEGTVIIRSIHWFEPAQGLLKVQVESVRVKYMGLTFPVVLDGSVELLKFIPGN